MKVFQKNFPEQSRLEFTKESRNKFPKELKKELLEKFRKQFLTEAQKKFPEFLRKSQKYLLKNLGSSSWRNTERSRCRISEKKNLEKIPEGTCGEISPENHGRNTRWNFGMTVCRNL